MIEKSRPCICNECARVVPPYVKAIDMPFCSDLCRDNFWDRVKAFRKQNAATIIESETLGVQTKPQVAWKEVILCLSEANPLAQFPPSNWSLRTTKSPLNLPRATERHGGAALFFCIYFFPPFLSSFGFEFECGPKNKKIKITAAIIKVIFSITIIVQ